MARHAGVALVVVTCLACAPARVWAQAASAIAGVVKDTTGAVLPGVTVEASSPALIERTRSVVSDPQGQYKIVDLRPGTYTVTFSIAGFSTVKREGIELSAAFTATVNAELRVGALEETITVAGQSPMVDTQNVVQQKVIRRDFLESLPNSRSNYAALTPGASRSNDVGGSSGNDAGATFTIHGGKGSDTRRLIDGMRWNSMEVQNAGTGFYFDPTGAEEISIQLGGNSAEYELGGVQVNLVPKSGGNTFKGYLYGAYTNNSLNSTSLPADLRGRGLPTIGAVDRIYDYSGSLGGPIRQDKLWFFSAQRWWGNSTFVPGDFYNADTSAWIYVPDAARPAVNDNINRHHSARFTWQASPRNRLNLSWDLQQDCVCHSGLTGAAAPEGVHRWNFGPPNYILQVTWSRPATSRLLFEAGATTLIFDYPTVPTEPLPLGTNQISVLEQSTNFRYRSSAGTWRYGHKITDQSNQRFAVSYVTGSHAFKTGVQIMEGWRHFNQEPNGSLDYNFLNGAPQSLIEYATPLQETERLKADLGIFAQDQWTIQRLTLNLGLRFDYLNAFDPPTSLPPGPFVPAREFPAVTCAPCWKDLNPRIGVAYDVFGNGRTAVKGSVGRFVGGEAVDVASALHPVNAAVNATTRTWTDTNRNFVAECDLTNPAINGECGAIDNLNFGRNNPLATTYAPNLLDGWGLRLYNWQAQATFQHQLREGVAVNVGYFRTWYGNFSVTENQAVTPSDFSPYCVPLPNDTRLPGGGGNAICGLYDVTPDNFGVVRNVINLSSRYGKQTEVYDGFDLTLNARLRGLFVSGGMNTGRTEADTCEVVTNNPQVQFTSPRTGPFCDVVTSWAAQTQVKLAAVYNLPWDAQVSATLQHYPGIAQSASFVASSALAAPSLGRNLAAGARANVTIANVVPPQTMFEDRYSQIDIRLAKTFRVGRSRLQGIVDLFNAFNARPPLALNARYGTSWLTPTSTLIGRLAKFGAKVEF